MMATGPRQSTGKVLFEDSMVTPAIGEAPLKDFPAPKPRIIVTMQSGKEFDLDGDQALEVHEHLSGISAQPITVKWHSDRFPVHATIVPRYVESFVLRIIYESGENRHKPLNTSATLR